MSYGYASGLGPGAMIATPEGPIPVEWLSVGDLILTRDNGPQPLLWIGRSADGSRQVFADAKDHNLVIAQETFGPGSPDHPLALSSQHRVLLDGPDVQLHFGEDEVFCQLDYLKMNTAIGPDIPSRTPLVQLLFERHEVICANGLWVESLWVDDDVAQSLHASVKQRLDHRMTARRSLQAHEGRLIAELHRGNQKNAARKVA